ncbi:hypothetical protein C8N24_1041 [Solirubrobacter pauli]|uniref:Uncharacterized protein n=1 Tax=Solirubrobacter pauli TaxID=166793 RepID=A0A660LBD3_9ACTN|nr:hypothetical protein C8N24_1041 [Solirubrobacter pauli]
MPQTATPTPVATTTAKPPFRRLVVFTGKP